MVEIANNKKIAKNTVFLYLRLIITMLVSLYTSRVVLNVLGVSDFGLYNIVGGVITLFGFVNGTMTGCTQRYLSIALGKGESDFCKKTFGTSLRLHIYLAIISFIVLELVGQYFLLFVLNIPEGREFAAQVVFQITLIAFSISFVHMPFEAAVIAHERMDFYAYLSIFDVVARLLVVSLISLFTSVDSLILYAGLLLGVTCLLFIIYFLYSTRKFEMCDIRAKGDKMLRKEMVTYTFWNILGHFSWVISTQGYNIIFNVFYGTVINAGRAIAVQVSGAVTKFTNGFQVAYTPQIIKLYAVNDYDKMIKLIANSTKMSFYLVLVFAIPMLCALEPLLRIWLKIVPDFAVVFTQILLLRCFISALYVPLDTAIVATGKVKNMNVANTIAELAFLVLSYILLYFSTPVMLVIPIALFPPIVMYSYLLFLLKKYINLDIKHYINDVWGNIIRVLLISLPIPILISHYANQSVLNTIAVAALCGLCSVIGIFVGMGKNMRKQLVEIIKNKINKK